jgi:excinuclease UvrABC ATPase subunit
VLEYHLGGRDISEVLAMSVTEAEEFFGAGEARTPAAHAILTRLADVGLGYLSLGQPLTTLSGGERQRLKLATHMARRAASTSSTSRPPACTSPTSSSCSACSTGSSTPASR